jgi:homoserine O-acetyltransferase
MQADAVFAADNYQRYQGLKLVNRFNAVCYYRLTQAMDSHDVGRNRGGLIAALQKISAQTLVIGIESDVLYPIEEQEFLHRHIKGSEFLRIVSDFGHDGFLLEYERIEKALKEFLDHGENRHYGNWLKKA